MVGYRCMNCMWFDNQHESLKQACFADKPRGYCRKHKPGIIQTKAYYYGVWPLVDPLDFCGEFRQDVTDGMPNGSLSG